MVLNKIKSNWKAGLAVALVSIPLSISLAVASGSTPTAGIITAVWAGLIASIFGGSNFNIVGPTGALSGIVATYALAHGPQSLPVLTMTAGLLILLAYACKLERYLIFIPSSVIHGFTLGVAFIIGLNQLNYALGLDNLAHHENLFINLSQSIMHLPHISIAAFSLFACFFLSLILLRRLIPQIPGAILLAPIGIGVGYLGKMHTIPLSFTTLGDKFADISFTLFSLPDAVFGSHLLQTAAVVALIAILETLLSAKIADSMTHTKHDERKEMFGLGLANLVSGLAGGIPATAALARTALNIKAGATSKIAATLACVLIAVMSFFFLGLFRYIPLAVIAAILVYVSYQMIEVGHFIRLFKYERIHFFIAMVVAFVTVYKDPIVGILLGATISLLVIIDKISQGQFDIKLNKRGEGIVGTLSGEKIKELDNNADVVWYSIKGKLCYINCRAHVERFEGPLDKYKYIILRLREVYFIDLDGAAALDEIIEIAHSKGQKIMITGVSTTTIDFLERASKGYQKLKAKGLVFKKSQEALNYLEKTYNIELIKKTTTA